MKKFASKTMTTVYHEITDAVLNLSLLSVKLVLKFQNLFKGGVLTRVVKKGGQLIFGSY